MADQVRQSPVDLIDQLAAQAKGASFFQAIALLDAYFGGPTTGAVPQAGREHVRFRAWPSLSFAAGDVVAIERKPPDENGHERVVVTVTFLGLFGPASPLPPDFTERVMGIDREQRAPRDFLDLFNHRFISLFYRIWTKYRYHVEFVRDGSDPISRQIFGLMGVLPEHRGGEDRLDWMRLLPYCGLLAMDSRSATTIARVLSAYFDVPVAIEENVERVIEIEPSQRARLGQSRVSLAADWILGSRMRDVTGKFRVLIGPTSGDVFRSFLPNQPNAIALRKLILWLLRDRLDYEVRVIVEEGQLAGLRLGGDAPLGWASWLGRPDAAGEGIVLPATA